MILVDCRGGRITPRNVYRLLQWCTNTYVQEGGREIRVNLFVPSRVLRAIVDSMGEYNDYVPRYEWQDRYEVRGVGHLLGYVNTDGMRMSLYHCMDDVRFRNANHALSIVHPVSHVILLQAHNFST